MQYCATARRLRIIAAPWWQLPRIYFECRIACRRVQRNAEVVAESGEIDSPFSILGCAWMVCRQCVAVVYTYASRETCTSSSLSMGRTRDTGVSYYVTYYVREIYRRHPHDRWTAWYDCRKSFPVRDCVIGKFTQME